MIAAASELGGTTTVVAHQDGATVVASELTLPLLFLSSTAIEGTA